MENTERIKSGLIAARILLIFTFVGSQKFIWNIIGKNENGVQIVQQHTEKVTMDYEKSTNLKKICVRMRT